MWFGKYEVGGELVPHVDRPQFSETVYTCVLKTSTSSSLTMTSPDGVPTRLPEIEGSTVALSGKARHVWRHGVPKLDEGTRISLSWRYLQSVGVHGRTIPEPKVLTKNFKIKELPKILILSLCAGIGAVPFAAESMWPKRVNTHA